MSEINICALDIILIIPLAYGVFTGMRHGFVKEVASWVGFVLAMYFARYFSQPVGEMLVRGVGLSADISDIVAFAVVFVLVLSMSSLIARMITKIIRFAMLGPINRLLGGAFGFLKYLLLMAAIIHFVGFLEPYLHLEQSKAVRNSRLYNPVKHSVNYILPHLHLDELSDMIHAESDKFFASDDDCGTESE